MSFSTSKTTFMEYFRITFLGSTRVGKTSIIQWILDQKPPDEYKPTIGLKIHNLDTVFNNNQYFLQFNDISGHEIYSDVLYSILKDTSVVILVFDYKNKETQKEIMELYGKTCEHISQSRILIFGNKFDGEKKEIPKVLSSWTKSNNLTIYPISVRENIGKSLLLQNIMGIITSISNEEPIETVNEIDGSSSSIQKDDNSKSTE